MLPHLAKNLGRASVRRNLLKLFQKKELISIRSVNTSELVERPMSKMPVGSEYNGSGRSGLDRSIVVEKIKDELAALSVGFAIDSPEIYYLE